MNTLPVRPGLAMSRSRILAGLSLLALGLILTPAHNRLPPAQAAIASGTAGSNTINAVNQLTSLFVPSGATIRVNVSGTFTGTLGFTLSQDGGTTWNAVSLYNLTATTSDSSTTGTGSWLYMPTTGNDGILRVQATAWTSGTAMVAIVDLAQNTPQLDLVLLPSAARTATANSTVFKNSLWRGIVIYLNITSAGTTGLTVQLKIIDPLTGATSFSAIGSARAVNGQFACVVYPAASLAAWSGGSLDSPLPSQWQVTISAGDSSSFTYTVSATLLK